MDGLTWRKSSRSAGNGACVEVAWRKSSLSSDTANCVEVGAAANRVLVRDTKLDPSPVLSFPGPAWADFLDAVKNGDIAP